MSYEFKIGASDEQNIINLVNRRNGTNLTLDDVSVDTDSIINYDYTDEYNVVLVAKPNSKYSGSINLTYNRLNADYFNSDTSPFNFKYTTTPVEDFLKAFSTRYGRTFVESDFIDLSYISSNSYPGNWNTSINPYAMLRSSKLFYNDYNYINIIINYSNPTMADVFKVTDVSAACRPYSGGYSDQWIVYAICEANGQGGYQDSYFGNISMGAPVAISTPDAAPNTQIRFTQLGGTSGDITFKYKRTNIADANNGVPVTIKQSQFDLGWLEWLNKQAISAKWYLFEWEFQSTEVTKTGKPDGYLKTQVISPSATSICWTGSLEFDVYSD